ncbi:MAG TPA: sigma factor [Ottowia sp.]|nr:sigma factor [Ottowia sp.]
MQAYAAGDARAFEILYDRHHLRLWRYVYRSIGEPASADELAQEVWFSVARAGPRYAPSAAAPDRPVARFSTWLFTLAHHRLVDHLRARRPHASLEAGARTVNAWPTSCLPTPASARCAGSSRSSRPSTCSPRSTRCPPPSAKPSCSRPRAA